MNERMLDTRQYNQPYTCVGYPHCHVVLDQTGIRLVRHMVTKPELETTGDIGGRFLENAGGNIPDW